MTTLRTAQPDTPVESVPVEEKTPDAPTSTDVEPSLAVYESKSGKPYIAKFFDAETVWDKLEPDTQSNAELINEYFQEQVTKNKVRSDKVAYRDYIRKFEKLTDTQDAPFVTKVHKISEFIRFLQRTA